MRTDRGAAQERQDGDDEDIAHAITANNPDVHLMVLLVDERPEELDRNAAHGEGRNHCLDLRRAAARHVHVAEMVIERAKRLVELKKDVVILLDSITRLARAYNNVVPSSGKALSGGCGWMLLRCSAPSASSARPARWKVARSPSLPRRWSSTGSRMDEVIFEEFKGTGNCEST